MRKRTERTGTARMLDVEGLCAYLSAGRNSALQIAKEAHARREFSTRLIRFDRVALDRYLDEMEESEVGENAK